VKSKLRHYRRGTGVDQFGWPLVKARSAQAIIVEIRISTELRRLVEELSQMRTWLDHMGYRTVGFRQISGTPFCRVDFDIEFQARDLARAFSGQLLPS
jgi:hypothetical protein